MSHIQFRVTVTLTCDLVLRIFCVQSISLILFEKGIPNLVCECILEWLSVLYHLRVTVTLTSDLILIIIVSGAYLLLFEIEIPNLVCECILGWWSLLYHLQVTVTLTSGLVFRKNHVQSISLIVLKVGIPNLVGGCNFG